MKRNANEKEFVAWCKKIANYAGLREQTRYNGAL